jgi:hypothetical protein
VERGIGSVMWIPENSWTAMPPLESHKPGRQSLSSDGGYSSLMTRGATLREFVGNRTTFSLGCINQTFGRIQNRHTAELHFAKFCTLAIGTMLYEQEKGGKWLVAGGFVGW